MNNIALKIMVLLFVASSTGNDLYAQTPVSDLQDAEHETGPFRDMPWMHVHEQYNVSWLQLPKNNNNASEKELGQYLYESLSPSQVVILTKWINYLKEHGLPENSSQYAGVKIHLQPRTYNPASLPPPVSNVLKKK